MSSRRSRLFKTLRVWFFSNLILSFFLVSWFLYIRSDRSKLVKVVEQQLAFNIRLSSDLAFANNLLTNKYFCAASSFVSNVVSSYVSPSFSNSYSVAAFPSSNSSEVDFPPLSFHGYFEIDRVPYICIRNQRFRRGDIVLGYPIEDISPDVVKYRGKFFKVE